MTDLVLVQQRDHIVEIILNRPDKLNAGNISLMDALDAAIESVEKLSDARVVLLRGEGRAFCVGLDLAGSEDIVAAYGENWQQNLFPLTNRWQATLNKLEACSLPVIALLHGFAIGLGCEIALACDFRIIAQRTLLSLPETRLGLIPDVGGTTRMTRLIGPARAKELIMTGRRINLEDAERWGLVNYVVPKDKLMEKAEALAKELCEAAPLAVNYAKRVINDLSDIRRGMQLEAWGQSVLMRTEDFATGAEAMVMKQKPEWKGK